MSNPSAPVVTVVDYGIGNLYSVQRALETCGAQVELTADPARIAQAQRLVLPGVGAFADGCKACASAGWSNRCATLRRQAGRCWAFAWACRCWPA